MCPKFQSFSLSLGGVGRCQSAYSGGGSGVNGGTGRRQRAAARLAATKNMMANSTRERAASDFDSPSASSEYAIQGNY